MAMSDGTVVMAVRVSAVGMVSIGEPNTRAAFAPVARDQFLRVGIPRTAASRSAT